MHARNFTFSGYWYWWSLIGKASAGRPARAIDD